MPELAADTPTPTEAFTIPATAVWAGGLAGAGTVRAASAALPLSVPTELGGQGAGETPESLLAAAAAACYAITLGAILANRGLPVAHLEVEAELQLVKTGHRAAIAGVKLRPRVSLADGGEVPRALLEKAERACLVGKALGAGIPIGLAEG